MSRVGRSACAALLLSAACGSPETPPDVLLITIDTLRADRLGSWGSPLVRTPVLDALAARGCQLRTAIAPVPLTLPSHTSMMTGLHPHRHGVRRNEHVLTGAVTLAERLAAAGWSTGAAVGGAPLAASFGLARGFGVYDDRLATRAEESLPEHHPARLERGAAEVVDAALSMLDAEEPSPIFLWTHFYDPHDPYDPPGPSGRGYAGEVEHVDREIGRLLREVRSRRSRPAWILVLSDHGEGLGEHGESTHGLFVYDTTMRIPWIAAGPGVRPGAVVSEQVAAVDLAPTVLALLGLDPIPGADGRSLAAAIREGREPAPRSAYVESLYAELFGWSPLSGMRTREWKYVAAPRAELYDLMRDPREAENRMEQDAAPAAALDGELRELEARGGAAPAVAAAADREKLEALGYVTGAPAAGAPSDADPKDRAAVLEMLIRAEGHRVAGRAEAAIAAFREALGADPDNPHALQRLGALHAGAGRPDEALRCYRAAERARPAGAELHFLTGDALYLLGERAAAAEAFRRAAEMQPGRVAAHMNLGVCLLEAGRVEEARAAFERTVALAPEDERAVGNLGMAVLRGGDEREALSLLGRAHQLRPEGFPYALELGLLLLKNGERAEGERVLASVEGARRPLALLHRAALAHARGEKERALEHLREAVRLGGEGARVEAEGPSFSSLRKLPEARAILER